MSGKTLGALVEKESRCESEEVKMCRRKKGVAFWSDTLESHGEVSCGGNWHEGIGWVVLFVFEVWI